MQILSEKNLCWQKILTFKNKLKQSETHSLDVSHCWNFNAGIKNFDFPIPSYAVKKMIFHASQSLQMWNLLVRSFRNTAKIKMSCSGLHSWEFRSRLCWTEISLRWRKSLAFRNKINQSEILLLVYSLCRSSNAGIEKNNFPLPSPALSEKLPNKIVFPRKSIFNLCLRRSKRLDIELKRFKNTFINFRTISILTDQLQKLIFITCSSMQLWGFRRRPFLPIFQPVATEKFNFANRDCSIWYALTECFTLWKLQWMGQTLWFSNPNPRSEFEASDWDFFQKKAIFSL